MLNPDAPKLSREELLKLRASRQKDKHLAASHGGKGFGGGGRSARMPAYVPIPVADRSSAHDLSTKLVGDVLARKEDATTQAALQRLQKELAAAGSIEALCRRRGINPAAIPSIAAGAGEILEGGGVTEAVEHTVVDAMEHQRARAVM